MPPTKEFRAVAVHAEDKISPLVLCRVCWSADGQLVAGQLPAAAWADASLEASLHILHAKGSFGVRPKCFRKVIRTSAKKLGQDLPKAMVAPCSPGLCPTTGALPLATLWPASRSILKLWQRWVLSEAWGTGSQVRDIWGWNISQCFLDSISA